MDEAYERVDDVLQRARAYQAPATIITIAKLAAIKAVKRDIKARGRKLAYVEQSAIVTAAHQHLHDHPELIDQAAETVKSSTTLRTLAEREARQRKGNQR